MKLDKTKDPKIRIVDGGVRVILMLEGDEGSIWKLDYDAACRSAGIQAHAINDVPPWAISLTVADGTKVGEQLDGALDVIQNANQAYSDRRKPSQIVSTAVSTWWEAVRLDRPRR